jgi:hypothetical protein
VGRFLRCSGSTRLTPQGLSPDQLPAGALLRVLHPFHTLSPATYRRISSGQPVRVEQKRIAQKQVRSRMPHLNHQSVDHRHGIVSGIFIEPRVVSEGPESKEIMGSLPRISSKGIANEIPGKNDARASSHIPANCRSRVRTRSESRYSRANADAAAACWA